MSGSPTAGRQTTTALIATTATAASTPDNAAFTVTTTGFTLTMQVQLLTWTPASDHWLMSQGSAGSLAWNLVVQSNGRLRCNVSADGTALTGAESSVATGFLPDSPHWLQVTMLPNFIGQCGISYFTCPTENGRDFVRLGSAITAGAGVTPFDSSAVLSIPGTTVSTTQLTYSVQFVNPQPSTQATFPRFDTMPPRQPSFTDDYARPWTINPPGLIGVV